MQYPIVIEWLFNGRNHNNQSTLLRKHLYNGRNLIAEYIEKLNVLWNSWYLIRAPWSSYTVGPLTKGRKPVDQRYDYVLNVHSSLQFRTGLQKCI